MSAASSPFASPDNALFGNVMQPPPERRRQSRSTLALGLAVALVLGVAAGAGGFFGIRARKSPAFENCGAYRCFHSVDQNLIEKNAATHGFTCSKEITSRACTFRSTHREYRIAFENIKSRLLAVSANVTITDGFTADVRAENFLIWIIEQIYIGNQKNRNDITDWLRTRTRDAKPSTAEIDGYRFDLAVPRENNWQLRIKVT